MQRDVIVTGRIQGHGGASPTAVVLTTSFPGSLIAPEGGKMRYPGNEVGVLTLLNISR